MLCGARYQDCFDVQVLLHKLQRGLGKAAPPGTALSGGGKTITGNVPTVLKRMSPEGYRKHHQPYYKAGITNSQLVYQMGLA
jgi:hypothetical protein